MNKIKYYLTKSDCYNSGRRITPIGVQIHSIGTAQSSAKALGQYWNQPGIDACVHYAVDADTVGKVLQFLPENFRSWADAGYGNNNLISIEMMESDYMKYTGGANYTVTNQTKFQQNIKCSYQGCVELTASICQDRGWNPKTKLASGLHLVSSHQEGYLAGLSSGHIDPTQIWKPLGLDMDQFRSDVAAVMKNGVPSTPDEDSSSGADTSAPEKYYRIRITWENAASQKGAYATLQNAERACPAGYSVYDWTGNKVYVKESTPGDLPYSVKVIPDALNIRQGPGSGKPVTGTISDQGVYTIVQEKRSGGHLWGKLLSGAGWIALEYTEKTS